MKTNEQSKNPGQEKFTMVGPVSGGDQKKPVEQPIEQPTPKAGEEHQDKVNA